MIKICLVEDQTLVRQGLQTLLDLVEDIDVIAEAKDGEEALRIIPQVKPDVVLLDIYLPKRNGLEVLRELKQSQSLPPTLILTTFDEDKFVIGGLQAGAKGYLLKDVSLDQLTGAIRTLAGGGTLVQPSMTQRLLENLDRIRCDLQSADLILPTTDGREIRLRRITEPTAEQKSLLQQLGLTLPDRLESNHKCSVDSATA